MTEGAEPATSRPSLFDITGRAKWDSWKSTGNKHAGREAEAQERYVSIAASCGWVQGETVNEACAQELKKEPSAEELLSRETPKRNSDEAGTGAVVSTVSMEDEGIDDEETLHGLAIVGDPTKMKQFLKDNSDANLNVVDEYVGDLLSEHPLFIYLSIIFEFVGLYTSTPRQRSRAREGC